MMTISKTSLGEMRRRDFLALAGAGMVASGLSSATFAQTKVKELVVQLNWLETSDFAPSFAAELRGFDTARGIKQTFIPGGPQIIPIQSVAGGAAPVGIVATLGACAVARASGIPVKVLGAFNRTSPIGLISLADNPIKTPADAVGKRIGLQGGARLTWSIILKENNINEKDMTIVPVGGDVSPLVSRQVDGFWGSAVNQHIALTQSGVANHMMTAGEVGAPEHFKVLFTLEDTASKRRGDIVAWLAAMVEGERDYMKNPDEVAEYIVKRSPNLQLKVDQMKAQARAILSFINPHGRELELLRIDEESAAKSLAQLVAQGELQFPVALADLLDKSLLDEAYSLLR